MTKPEAKKGKDKRGKEADANEEESHKLLLCVVSSARVLPIQGPWIYWSLLVLSTHVLTFHPSLHPFVIHARLHACTPACLHACMPACLHALACMPWHACMHACMHA